METPNNKKVEECGCDVHDSCPKHENWPMRHINDGSPSPQLEEILAKVNKDYDEYLEGCACCGDPTGYSRAEAFDLMNTSYRAGERAAIERVRECPPHNFVDYHFVGGWAASIPPPNKKCTKCLREERF